MGRNEEPNEIRIIRVYDAPLKMVWDAWVDPKQAAQWWGPRGFTITTHSKELRPGGIWHYTMHGPDGVDYPNKTLYLEVDPQARLVYDHGGNDDRPPMFRVTALFKDLGKNRTELDMSMRLPTPEAATEARKFIKKAGGNATWDRLAEYLEESGSGKDVFVINRSFAAPIETIFDLWTDPKHVEQWLPPVGFSMRYIRAEIKEGGESFYSMSDGGSVTMYGLARYLEVKRPDRLVYTQQFCDEKGGVSRHPLAPTWPESMRTTVIFSKEGPEDTRVTITWQVEGNASREERETFHQSKGGMTAGWTGSFDKLEAYLREKI